MESFPPNISTTSDVISTITSLVKTFNLRVFVDAGCGNGEVLLSVAKQNPNTLCIGIEIIESIANSTKKRILNEQLSNILIIEGDARNVLKIVENPDLIYCYIGSSIHQSLAIHLLKSQFAGKVLSALYPCEPLPYSQVFDDLSLPLFLYDVGESSNSVVWDNDYSVSLINHSVGTLLNSKAIKVFQEGDLELKIISQTGNFNGNIGILKGLDYVFIGQIVLVDFIISIQESIPSPICVEVEAKISGIPMKNRLKLIIGNHPTHCIDIALRQDSSEAKLIDESLLNTPTFYQLVSSLDNNSPAAKDYDNHRV